MAPNQSTTRQQPCEHINDLPIEILSLIFILFIEEYNEGAWDSNFVPTCFSVWRVCKLWSEIVFDDFVRCDLEWCEYANEIKNHERRYVDYEWCEYVNQMKGREREYVDHVVETLWHPLNDAWNSDSAIRCTSRKEWEIIRIVVKHKVDEDVAKFKKELVKSWLW